MPTYSFKSMLASLSITDIPAGYTPPVGPAINNAITYNQKDNDQPSTFTYFNLGPKWTLTWLSYIQDDPISAGTNVFRYMPGGGGVTYSGYSASTGEFSPEERAAAVLVRTSASPITYELRFPDGGKNVFSVSDGKTTYPRKVFLKSIVDPQGNAAVLNYDAQLRLTSVIDTIGQGTTFQYTNSGNSRLVTGITDPFGRSATLGYDANGRLNSVTDVIGMTSTFTYDSSTFIQSMTTPYGTTTFAHTEQVGSTTQASIQATDPDGRTERTEFRHSAPGIPFSDARAPAGMGVQNQYLNYRNSFYWDKDVYASACSGSGTATTCDYTKARIKHFAHEAGGSMVTSGLIESIKYPLESRIWYAYPGQSDTIHVGTLDRPTYAGRVTDNNATQLTSYTYNNKGRILTEKDPVGRETHYAYDANGIDALTVTQKNGSVYDTIAQYTYNAHHQPLTYTDASNATTTYTYNARGQLTSVKDALNHTTTYEYDTNGYLKNIKNNSGTPIYTYTYDAYGRIRTESYYGYTRSFDYDALDRTTSIEYPGGTSTVYTWDRLDLAGVTDRELRATTYDYNAEQQLVTETDHLGHQRHFTHYANGRLHTQEDQNGHVTTWDRDIEGRVITKKYDDNSSISYQYDLLSRLWQTTDALGQVKIQTYELDDKPAATTYQNTVNSTPNVSYTYDPYYPWLVSMTDGVGTTTFFYTPPGSWGALRLHHSYGPYGTNDLVAYQYNIVGKLNAIVASQTDWFLYDSLGRLSANTNPLGTFTYSYVGDTPQPQYQVLTSSSANGYRLTYAYDGDSGDRQLQLLSYKGTGALLATRAMTFTHSTEHQLLSKSDYAKATLSTRTEGYNYDDLDRLTTTTANGNPSDNYSYDDVGNPVVYSNGIWSITASANALNQLTTVNGVSWTYDANGNLTNDGSYSYAWDAENRLISVTSLSTNHITGFKYDGLGHRAVISEQDSGGPVTETRLIWCGEHICQANNENNQVVASYFDEGEQHGSTLLYYVKDQIGSIVGVMNGNGDPIGSTLYEAYGNVKLKTGTTTDFGFGRMLYNEATGLYLANYRAYKPSIGRWLSRDPAGEAVSPNLYAYVAGNPLRYADPSGLIAGDMPPYPPGYDPDTWTRSSQNGRIVLTDSQGIDWAAHPEDEGHWPHWDKQVSPGSKQTERWPKNSLKPWPNQKKPPYGDQCDSDPGNDGPRFPKDDSGNEQPPPTSGQFFVYPTILPLSGPVSGVFIPVAP